MVGNTGTHAEDICSVKHLFADHLTSDQRCELALQNCEATSLINFYQVYFCWLDSIDAVWYPFGVSTKLWQACGPVKIRV